MTPDTLYQPLAHSQSEVTYGAPVPKWRQMIRIVTSAVGVLNWIFGTPVYIYLGFAAWDEYQQYEGSNQNIYFEYFYYAVQFAPFYSFCVEYVALDTIAKANGVRSYCSSAMIPYIVLFGTEENLAAYKYVQARGGEIWMLLIFKYLEVSFACYVFISTLGKEAHDYMIVLKFAYSMLTLINLLLVTHRIGQVPRIWQVGIPGYPEERLKEMVHVEIRRFSWGLRPNLLVIIQEQLLQDEHSTRINTIRYNSNPAGDGQDAAPAVLPPTTAVHSGTNPTPPDFLTGTSLPNPQPSFLPTPIQPHPVHQIQHHTQSNQANQASSVASSITVSATVPSTPAALPAGWEMCTHPQTGKVYYQNHVTKKTQWNRPQA
jgi:hypothetical protein